MCSAFMVTGQNLGQYLPFEVEQPCPLEGFGNQLSSASRAPFETVIEPQLLSSVLPELIVFFSLSGFGGLGSGAPTIGRPFAGDS